MVEVSAQSGDQRVPTSVGGPATAADSPVIGTGRATSGVFETAVSVVWRFFASVRVAIWEIAFLAVLTLIGTLRGSGVPRSIADRVPALQNLVDAWYGWDTFGSWLYTVTLALIAVGIIIGGMLNRIPGMWKTIVQPTVRTTRGFLLGTAPHAALTVATAQPALVAELELALRRRRYRVLTARVGDDTHVYADRNRWGKLGTFPFHIALVMLVVGGIVVTQFGFRDVQFIVPEGETVAIGRGTDLSVRLNRFNEDYYQDGTAARYQSDVTLVRDGNDVRGGLIEPNQPLSEGGVNVYQSGFGYDVRLRVTDRTGNELFHGPVTLGEFAATSNPDAPAGLLPVPGTNTTLTLIASDRDIPNRPDLDTLGLRAEQLYVQARSNDQLATVSPISATVDPTQPARLGDLTVQFERYGVYSVLQVAYYPGLWIFGVAAVLGVGGLIAIFYFPLRRLRAIVTSEGDDRARVLLAPLARRDWSGKRDFVELVEDLRQRHGSAVRLSDEPVRASSSTSGR